ncbi:NAD(P)-dependent alcohol dehydrogenase [Dactylosporangium sp. NPDC048998]|uniref:NAD(P)-dependent alcohol dehydrogenase n=1 Tax=Dactylosporangium sp. NPDC048998 TaxID=3363976 RepID=UPI003711D07A
MKAIVQERYGSSETLRLLDVDPPAPAEGEVLVRVRAAAVNARDWHIMRGDPYLARLMMPSMFGRDAPRRPIRGSDFAGVVEAVGAGVTRFAPGDEVYGDLREDDGAFAELARVPVGYAEHKPAGLTFEQAAAVPLAGTTALVALRDYARVRAGQHVLINGASGGVGTFAVQLAKAFGAEVTGVCSTRNAELVAELGADHVVDYTREDFTRTGERYDVVFDLVGNRTLGECRRALADDGTLVLAGGGVSGGGRPSVVGPMTLTIRATLAARLGNRRILPLLNVPPSAEVLATLRDFLEAGQITPAIDRTYPLDRAAEAVRYLEIEHARAKVVITV